MPMHPSDPNLFPNAAAATQAIAQRGVLDRAIATTGAGYERHAVDLATFQDLASKGPAYFHTALRFVRDLGYTIATTDLPAGEAARFRAWVRTLGPNNAELRSALAGDWS